MSWRVKLGLIISTLWIVAWSAVLASDWDSARHMHLNEWGDLLAGLSAPLAFLWLVIGYFQQGEELRQNTEALKQQEKALAMQAEELNRSVVQQERSATVLEQQKKLDSLNAQIQAYSHVHQFFADMYKEVEKDGALETVKGVSKSQLNAAKRVIDLVAELDQICNNAKS